MYSHSGHPRCRGVSSSDLEKCSIISLAQQWMLCSEWVPSEWESKQLIKTSQLYTPVHQLTSCEVKSCVLVETNPSLRYFNIKPLLLASPLSIILFFLPMKKLSHLSQERHIHRSSTACKPKTALNKYVGGFRCVRSLRTNGDTHFHWRKRY